MKTETTQITKVLVSDLKGEPFKLDPVTVILEDIGHRVIQSSGKSYTTRQGKIIVECYGKSWSAYWGGMGDRTVAQFFSDEHSEYLIGSLAPSLGGSRFSGGALVNMAKRVVLDCRRGRTANHHPYSMDKEEARKLVKKFVEDRPLTESVLTAQAILAGALFGAEDDPTGESQAGESDSSANLSREESGVSPASTTGQE